MEYKQTKYIIAIHGKEDEFAIENSIDEAKLYIEKFSDRKAVLISVTKDTDLEKINSTQVQTFKKGTIRQVNTTGIDDAEKILNQVYFGLKNGMMIVHDMPVSDQFSTKVLNHAEKGIDITIHRNDLRLTVPEINFIKNELDRASIMAARGENYSPAKRIILRMHLNHNFRLDPETLTKYVSGFRNIFGNKYGEELGGLIFLSQFIIHRMRIEYKRMCDVETRKNNEDPKYFIDPYHFKRDMATYIYIDLMNLQIIGNHPEFVEDCQKRIYNHFEQLQQKMEQNG